MTITTSLNKTYADVIYIDGPTRLSGTLMLRLADKRPILAIGAEFDRLEWIRRESEEQGNKEWAGYTQLISVHRMTETDVLIELAKP